MKNCILIFLAILFSMSTLFGNVNALLATNVATIEMSDSDPQLAAAVTYINNVTKSGQATGAIFLSITGGTAPYTVACTDGTWDNAQSAMTGLSAGNHTITITDAASNELVLNETVTESSEVTPLTTTIAEPPAIVPSNITTTRVTHYGSSNGSIAFDIDGGTPGYTIIWNLEGETSALGTQTLTEAGHVLIDGLAVGVYEIIVVDANSCQYQLLDQEVKSPLEVTLSFNPNGGTPEPADLLVMPGTNLGTLPVVTLVDYDFVGWFVDNTDLIEAGDQFIYTENKTAHAHYASASVSHIACFGETSGEITVDVVPNISINYNVDLYSGSSMIASITGNERTFSNLAPGNYVVKVRGIAIDTLEIIEAPELSLTALSSTTVQHGQQVILQATGAEIYTWTSEPAATITPYLAENMVTVSVMEPTVVTVAGEYKGCESVQAISIDVNACAGITSVTDVVNNNDVYSVDEYANICWFRENFKGVKYADETIIPFANGYLNPNDPTTLEANIETYGLIYDWNSAVRSGYTSSVLNEKVQGVCPTGWRMPTVDELTQLSLYYFAEELKSSTLWADGVGLCTDEIGFNALPAGWFNPALARYENMLAYTGFWSSSITTSGDPIFGQLRCYCGAFEIIQTNTQAEAGLSVRCVKAVDAAAITVTSQEGTVHGFAAAGDYQITETGFVFDGVETPIGTAAGAFSTTAPAGTTTYKAYLKIAGNDTPIFGEEKTL